MQKPRKLMPYHWVMILNNKRFNKILMNIFIITAAGEGHSICFSICRVFVKNTTISTKPTRLDYEDSIC
jgi:hypothetical protein